MKFIFLFLLVFLMVDFNLYAKQDIKDQKTCDKIKEQIKKDQKKQLVYVPKECNANNPHACNTLDSLQRDYNHFTAKYMLLTGVKNLRDDLYDEVDRLQDLREEQQSRINDFKGKETLYTGWFRNKDSLAEVQRQISNIRKSREKIAIMAAITDPKARSNSGKYSMFMAHIEYKNAARGTKKWYQFWNQKNNMSFFNFVKNIGCKNGYRMNKDFCRKNMKFFKEDYNPHSDVNAGNIFYPGWWKRAWRKTSRGMTNAFTSKTEYTTVQEDVDQLAEHYAQLYRNENEAELKGLNKYLYELKDNTKEFTELEKIDAQINKCMAHNNPCREKEYKQMIENLALTKHKLKNNISKHEYSFDADGRISSKDLVPALAEIDDALEVDTIELLTRYANQPYKKDIIGRIRKREKVDPDNPNIVKYYKGTQEKLKNEMGKLFSKLYSENKTNRLYDPKNKDRLQNLANDIDSLGTKFGKTVFDKLVALNICKPKIHVRDFDSAMIDCLANDKNYNDDNMDVEIDILEEKREDILLTIQDQYNSKYFRTLEMNKIQLVKELKDNNCAVKAVPCANGIDTFQDSVEGLKALYDESGKIIAFMTGITSDKDYEYDENKRKLKLYDNSESFFGGSSISAPVQTFSSNQDNSYIAQFYSDNTLNDPYSSIYQNSDLLGGQGNSSFSIWNIYNQPTNPALQWNNTSPLYFLNSGG